jgi:hypothetical protein
VESLLAESDAIRDVPENAFRHLASEISAVFDHDRGEPTAGMISSYLGFVATLRQSSRPRCTSNFVSAVVVGWDELVAPSGGQL